MCVGFLYTMWSGHCLLSAPTHPRMGGFHPLQDGHSVARRRWAVAMGGSVAMPSTRRYVVALVKIKLQVKHPWSVSHSHQYQRSSGARTSPSHWQVGLLSHLRSERLMISDCSLPYLFKETGSYYSINIEVEWERCWHTRYYKLNYQASCEVRGKVVVFCRTCLDHLVLHVYIEPSENVICLTGPLNSSSRTCLQWVVWPTCTCPFVSTRAHTF